MAHDSPQLTFWQWFSFSTNDYGQVMIKTEHQDWQAISEGFGGVNGGIWTNFYIPLDSYADSTVQIAFRLHTQTSGFWGDEWSTSFGWYIDNINVTGIPTGIDDEQTQNINMTKLLNYPNPFNPETTLQFDLQKAVRIQISIYNVKGQLVNTLINGYLDRGMHSIKWDGKDSSGISSASGIYFARLQYDNHVETRKMVMLK